jgi:hypothetical protein
VRHIPLAVAGLSQLLHFSVELFTAWMYRQELHRLALPLNSAWQSMHVLTRCSLVSDRLHALCAASPSGFDVRPLHIGSLQIAQGIVFERGGIRSP